MLKSKKSSSGSLLREISEAKKNVKTDSLQLSIGELASMYDGEELNIQPEFQRLFRWGPEKKSDFFESIMIGIPIPPIFAYENEDGTWELVDGLQRVSTLLEFMGILKDPATGEKLPPSRLSATSYLPSLNNVVWEKSDKVKDITLKDQVPLEKSQQLFIRRGRIDVQVLKQPSDVETKFHLFQRLNRGGAYANEQEVRTCAMVMFDPAFVNKIRKYVETENFKKLTAVTDDGIARQQDIENAVRFIVHVSKDYDGKSDIQEFLDKSILEIIEENDDDKVLSTLEETFEILEEALGDKALVPFAGERVGAGVRFSLRSLEAIAVGVGRNLTAIKRKKNASVWLRGRIKEFWNQAEVEGMSASGLRGTSRIQRTIPFGAQWFRP